ncbi:MAG: ABC transporter permease [Thermoplasmata archaeon]|nr:ABC transporter permease [Thermoplasmata archaeon]
MSISAPRYVSGPIPLVGRTHRTLAIVRRELARRAGWGTWVVVGLTYALVNLVVVLEVQLSGLFGALSLATFDGPYSSPLWPLLILIVASAVGAGSIAEDVGNRSITLYLSRPIHRSDYLIAKAAAVGTWIAIAAIGPGLVAVTIVASLGSVSASLALQAAAGFLAVGLVTTIFFTGLALGLSSITTKSLYAAVGIFGLTLSLEIGAAVVGGITGNPYVPYASPITDILNVAGSVFSVGGTLSTEPGGSALVLLVGGAASAAVAVWRLERVEVVGE